MAVKVIHQLTLTAVITMVLIDVAMPTDNDYSTELSSDDILDSMRDRRGLGLLKRLDKASSCEDTPCRRGREVYSWCNQTVDLRTLCIPCAYQFYQPERSLLPCRPCSKCAPGQRVVRGCIMRRNTLCSGDVVMPVPGSDETFNQTAASIKREDNTQKIPSSLVTMVLPSIVLLFAVGGALFIYIRIKRSGEPYDKVTKKEKQPISCTNTCQSASALLPKFVPSDSEQTSPNRKPLFHLPTTHSFASEKCSSPPVGGAAATAAAEHLPESDSCSEVKGLPYGKDTDCSNVLTVDS